jgi:4-alpha-glucanotransferase
MLRGSGILLHITSLPSKYGIGTLGKEAYDFVDFLHRTKQSYWQFLPTNPTSYGDSPYQSFSAFALNPYFIDLEELVKEGLLKQETLDAIDWGDNPRYVDYGKIYENRFKVLKTAFNKGYSRYKDEIKSFVIDNAFWLKDYALFMVIKKQFNNQSYLTWSDELKAHDEEVLKVYRRKYNREIRFYYFMQYLAYKQYTALRKYANENGIKIIGDVPIYVASDSADVWANSELFQLDGSKNPIDVAGVPPDYFSATGQLWGNPLYNYDKMKEDNFAWWVSRVKHASKLFDLLRIDHFRGFESYWAVPFGEKTAINGRWIKAPGLELFNAIKAGVPSLQIVAEDLGVITDEVRALKAQVGLPGIKVMMFSFSSQDPNDPHLPGNYEKNCVAYIGTHDNDVIKSFIKKNPHDEYLARRYFGIDEKTDLIDTMTKALFNSNADVAIITMQDLLRLDEESRMNLPGKDSGYWRYRMVKSDLTKEVEDYLLSLTVNSNRVNY